MEVNVLLQKAMQCTTAQSEALPPQLGAIKFKRNTKNKKTKKKKRKKTNAACAICMDMSAERRINCAATICYTSDYMHRDGNTVVYLPMTIVIIIE